jgi:hypothetical protein
MRKFLFIAVLAFSLFANAKENNFVNLKFGTSRSEALQIIKAQFGEPDTIDGDNLIYREKSLNGYQFNKIVFGFEPEGKGGYFNQARFFITKPTRKLAVQQRDSLAKYMETDYGVSCDYEENGNKFYKGGIAPTGIGFLFTICTQRREGHWTTELRYGAFHQLKHCK